MLVEGVHGFAVRNLGLVGVDRVDEERLWFAIAASSLLVPTTSSSIVSFFDYANRDHNHLIESHHKSSPILNFLI